MSYEVRSSEKLRKSDADSEAKALLYLMNYREDSTKMHFFVVDFFNDITGMDSAARKDKLDLYIENRIVRIIVVPDSQIFYNDFWKFTKECFFLLSSF